jgi:hypothetical protein
VRLRCSVGLWRRADRSCPSRVSDRKLRQVSTRIDRDAERFHDSLKDSLDHSSFNHTSTEKDILRDVKDLDQANDRPRSRIHHNVSSPGDVNEALSRGAAIDSFMQANA